MTAVSNAISSIPDSLLPLQDVAARFAGYPSYVSDDGALYVANRPWIAPLNYLFTAFPGIDQADIRAYESMHGIEIPRLYSEILEKVGGCFCFGLSLYGIPRSMLQNPPLLDRSKLQCLDLATAVKYWSAEFQLSRDWFHFGGRHYSSTENCGYFLAEDGPILAALRGGEIVSEWEGLSDFLHNELAASELLDNKLHPPQWDS